jgi:hypothetical protein
MNKNQGKERFVITKKIAKHGHQAVIIIPRVLEDRLKPGMLIELKIDVLEVKNERFD